MTRNALRHGLLSRYQRIGIYLAHGAEISTLPLINRVRLRRRVNAHAGRLGLVTPPRVLTLLHLTGLDEVFQNFDTAQDAIGQLAGSADG